jgi:hypothetical protein
VSEIGGCTEELGPDERHIPPSGEWTGVQSEILFISIIAYAI